MEISLTTKLNPNRISEEKEKNKTQISKKKKT